MTKNKVDYNRASVITSKGQNQKRQIAEFFALGLCPDKKHLHLLKNNPYLSKAGQERANKYLKRIGGLSENN